MAMERSISIGLPLEKMDLEKAVQLLTYKIAMIESDILIRHKVNKYKSLDDLILRYEYALENLMKELMSISKRLFKNTTIKHVKPYNNDNEPPESYRAYLNVAHNMADLICCEILEQVDGELALIVMERWVWILKNAFESNDFFIASSVINALRSSSLLKLNLEEQLSPLGRAILFFFEDLLPNQGAVYQLQKKKFDNGEEVVPILSTLTKMMDGIEQQQPTSERGKIETYCFIRKKKSRISLDFLEMQERLRAMLSNHTLEIISILSKKPQKEILNAFEIRQRKLDIDMLRLVFQIALYYPEDRYYEHHQALKQFNHRLNKLANELRDGKDSLKGELCVRKCMGIKNILQDDEASFEAKLDNVREMKLDVVCKSSKRLTSVLNEIEKVLAALVEIQEKMKWQSTPRGRHSRSGSQLTQSGFFKEKQNDAEAEEAESLEKKKYPKS